MNVDEVAGLAVAWFNDPGYDPPESGPVNRERAIIMTAIAGAESSFINDGVRVYNEVARGDKVIDIGSRYAAYACDGYLSFGLWQIFLGVHSPEVARKSGFTSPCPQSVWLFGPDNNAGMARDILNSQGYEAWSTYNGGQYKAFLPEATAAVDRVLNPPAPPPPAPVPQQVYTLKVWPDYSVTLEVQWWT